MSTLITTKNLLLNFWAERCFPSTFPQKVYLYRRKCVFGPFVSVNGSGIGAKMKVWAVNKTFRALLHLLSLALVLHQTQQSRILISLYRTATSPLLGCSDRKKVGLDFKSSECCSFEPLPKKEPKKANSTLFKLAKLIYVSN